MDRDPVCMVSATEFTKDTRVPMKVSRKQPVCCGCAFADTHNWRCCEAINDANWLKKETADRKKARLDATATRKKARLAARAALKKEKRALDGKKTRVKKLKRRKLRSTM
jgi:hypothetical protein